MTAVGETNGNVGHAPAVIAIRRCGLLANDICRRGEWGEIAAVFARSFYVRCGENFLCVGEPAIGNGPLTLTADFKIPTLGLRAGQLVSLSRQHIAISAAAHFVLDGCKPWRPPDWPEPAAPGCLIDACAAISGRGAVEAPPEALAAVVFGTPGASPALLRLAAPRIARFRSWLAQAFDRGPTNGAPIDGVIGLGPGLTPSGDDFLAGALAILDALTEHRVHAALGRAIGRAPSDVTSPLSWCLLKAAAKGHIGERLWDAVAALVSGDASGAIAFIQTIGHSSGWDTLAGMTTTLREVAASRGRSRAMATMSEATAAFGPCRAPQIRPASAGRWT
jgi:hypothetical protein